MGKTKMKVCRALLPALALAAMVFGFGCARKQDAGTKTASAPASLTVKGSDTMVNLMSNLAEAYMKAHPNVNVSVTGGGSGTGIAALINGTTDICAASRTMKTEEKDQAQKARGAAPQETVVGQDGLAVMVNKNNPVSELSIEQLRKIYTGEYTNWREVGGISQEIIVLSRESNSGTYVYFQEHVLEKKDYTPKARLLPSTAAITQAVTDDQNAIGYGGIAYAEKAAGVKMIRVKHDSETPAILPSEATVLDNTYPISRPLFLYTSGQPQGAAAEFIHYVLSPEGQKIVTDTGYIPVKKPAA
jgi:phosphate transport system substrate-binding protein